MPVLLNAAFGIWKELLNHINLGMVHVEYDKTKLNETEILNIFRKEGLDIPDSHVTAERFLSQTDKTGQAAVKEQEDKKEHDYEEGESHDHAHGGIFGKNAELIFSIICGILLGIGFGLSFVEAVPAWVSQALYIGAYFFGGFYTAKRSHSNHC